MKVFIVVEQIDLGYHIQGVFLDKHNANSYCLNLAANDRLAIARKAAGNPNWNRWYIEEYEVEDAQ